MAVQRKLNGILGGMGPLASAELVSTIYRESRFDREQEAPACVLYSDPSVPDRTSAILAGDVEPVAARLAEGIEALLGMGAHRVVIACVTAHGILSHVPEELRRQQLPEVRQAGNVTASRTHGLVPLRVQPLQLAEHVGLRERLADHRIAFHSEIAGEVDVHARG